MPENQLWERYQRNSDRETRMGPVASRPTDGTSATVDVIKAVLDCMPIGIVAVDDRAKVLYVNASARAIVESGHSLRLDNGILKGAKPSTTRTLHALIEQAISASRSRKARPALTAMSLSEPSFPRPLSITVVPHRQFPNGAHKQRPAAFVFIGDPVFETEISSEMLAMLFGLTRSEAALTVALLPGQGLKNAALRTRININTAKTHLKHVFEKTGTRSQAELIRLVMSSPAGLRLDA